MSSYSRHRRRRRFRRSPLSDLLTFLLLAVVIVALIFLICRITAPEDGPTSLPHSPSGSRSPAPDQSDTPDPSPSASQPAEIPWQLTLVNPTHPLPDNFAVQTTMLPNGLSFDSRAYDALSKMLADCRAAGLEPLVCSAYRSVETQEELFQQKINSYIDRGMSYDEAYNATRVEIAAPGTSEHSLGLAADICAMSYQLLDDAQANTAEQQWLMAHCSEYGFILRFPKEKEELTGIIYEPWHYRYVGEEAAKEIMERGLCLEEYMAEYYEIN